MKNQETIKVVYRGIEHEITMEEFRDLQEGWVTWSDMFD